jgi:hypothetical protein
MFLELAETRDPDTQNAVVDFGFPVLDEFRASPKTTTLNSTVVNVTYDENELKFRLSLRPSKQGGLDTHEVHVLMAGLKSVDRWVAFELAFHSVHHRFQIHIPPGVYNDPVVQTGVHLHRHHPFWSCLRDEEPTLRWIVRIKPSDSPNRLAQLCGCCN